MSCLSSADCWAVGMRSGAHPGNLLEHYAGSGGWRAVGTPAPQGELAAVSCEPAEDQCWAAGSSRDFRAAITFHLVGGRWHYVKPATVSASFVQVNGLGCESVDDCLLVGFITPKHGAGSALAERWNGHAWSRLAVGGERALAVVLWPASAVHRLVRDRPAGWLARPSARARASSRSTRSSSAGTGAPSPSSIARREVPATTPSSWRWPAQTRPHVRLSAHVARVRTMPWFSPRVGTGPHGCGNPAPVPSTASGRFLALLVLRQRTAGQ